MKKLFIFFSFLLLGWSVLHAQQQSWPGKFYKGYTRSLTTGKFSYHSPQPDVTESLLLRSIDSASYISWETEKIPSDFIEPYANFVWMFGIDANPESHTYRLYINGTYYLTFANPVVSEIKPWTVTGKNGCSLTFLTTMLDKYDDPMGYAVLKMPAGSDQKRRATGHQSGRRICRKQCLVYDLRITR